MSRTAAIFGIGRRVQRIALIRYLLALTLLSLAWEFAQMPLYTLGQTGTLGEIVYGAVHCTLGDAMIGSIALICALVAFGDENWPEARWVRVLCASVALGVAYTVFSEWWNVEVRGSWAYTDRMPVIPFVGTGLSPLLQWMVIPPAAFFLAVVAERCTPSGNANGTVKGLFLSPCCDDTAAPSGVSHAGQERSARPGLRPGFVVDASGETH